MSTKKATKKATPKKPTAKADAKPKDKPKVAGITLGQVAKRAGCQVEDINAYRECDDGSLSVVLTRTVGKGESQISRVLKERFK